MRAATEQGSRANGASHARRLLLRALIAAASLVALGSVFFGLWVAAVAGEDKSGAFVFDVGYAPPLDDAPEVRPVGADAEMTQAYQEITISSYEPLVLPRALAGVLAALPFIIVLLGCVSVIVLAARMLVSRPFSRAAQVLLALLGLVSAACAILDPWLSSRIGALAISELGLPTDGSMVANPELDPWVAQPSFDLLTDLQWPLFTLGITLLLISALWRRAERLQRDTEGLV